MKKTLCLLFAAGIFFSCNSSDSVENVDLIGNWRLIEILADPGNGSGTFTSVISDKIITFENGGTITSNGNLCDMSINSDNQTSGTYSVTNMTFNSLDCHMPNQDFSFEQNGNILIVNYPCIEPCRAKFIKE